MDNLSYEEYLAQNGSMTYSNVGVSMLPLLRQGRDLFTVRRKEQGRCKKGDVVLYRRPPSSYVLHRIIAVHETDYTILGDNCINKEHGITDDDIIGVMTGFVRDGKTHSVNEMGYRLYSWFWVTFAPVRVLWTRVRNALKRRLKR